MAVQLTSSGTSVFTGIDRVLVRTSAGIPYVVISDNGALEAWKGNSVSPTSFSEVDAGNGPTQGTGTAIICSAAIDSSDTIHVAYWVADGKDSFLGHATISSDTWTDNGSVADVGDDPPVSTNDYKISAAVDANDALHVTWTEGISDMGTTWDALYYVNNTGGGGFNTPVQVAGANNSPTLNASSGSLALNSSGHPQISYHSSGSTDLYEATSTSNNPSSFTLTSLETTLASDPIITLSIESEDTRWTAVRIGQARLFRTDTSTDENTGVTVTNDFGTVTGAVDGPTEDIYIFFIPSTGGNAEYDVFDAGAGSFGGNTELVPSTENPVGLCVKWSNFHNNYSSGSAREIDYIYLDSSGNVYWDSIPTATSISGTASGSSTAVTLNPSGWYNTSWSNRTAIYSEAITETGTDRLYYYPLSSLPTSTFWATVKSDGGDIRVTEADGETEVPIHVVNFDGTGDTGGLFFKADTSATSPNAFYVYYGNASATEAGPTDTFGRNNVYTGFQHVHHLNEDPATAGAGGVIDSTGSGTDGTPAGTTTGDSVAGKLDFNAYDFDASTDDRVEIDSTASGSYIPSFPATFLAWVKPKTDTDTKAINSRYYSSNGIRIWNWLIAHSGSGVGRKIRFQKWDTSDNSHVYDSSVDYAFTADVWSHFGTTISSDGTSAQHYQDGSALGTSGSLTSNSIQDTNSSLAIPDIGALARSSTSPDHPMDGAMTNVMIANTEWSASQISDYYEQTNDPTSFWFENNEEDAPLAGSIDGTASGTATVSGTLEGIGDLAGTSAGTATVAGTLEGIGDLAGTSNGVATVSGDIIGLSKIDGSADGVATVSGTLAGTGDLAGSSGGLATVAGTLEGTGDLAGSADGVATVTGTLEGTGDLTGTSSGVATVTGTIEGTGDLVGSSDGVATVTGTIGGIGDLAGTSSGVATVTGTLVTPANPIDGTINGTSTVSGTLSATGDLSGTSSGTATVTGTIEGTGDLAGTSSAVATVAGTLSADGDLAGTAPGTSTVTGTLEGTTSLSGSADGTSTVTGTLVGTGDLAGTSAGTGTVSGTLEGTGTLSGTSSGSATLSGTLINEAISGTASGTSTVNGTLEGTGDLTGTINGTSTVSGTLEGTGDLSGTASGTSTASATLSGTGDLEGTLSGSSSLFGTLIGMTSIDGTSAGTSIVTGTLSVPGGIEGTSEATSSVTGTISGIARIIGTVVGATTLSGLLSGESGGSVLSSPIQQGILSSPINDTTFVLDSEITL